MNIVPLWLPDWTRKAGYPAEDLPLPKWPWQFLRRNPEYQRLWRETIEPYLDEQGLLDENKWFEAECGRALTLAADAEFEARHPGREFGRRFGLKMPVPPAPWVEDGDLMFDHIFVGARWGSLADWSPGQLAVDEIEITFNLSWPLKQQLDRAQQILEGRQNYLEHKGTIVVNDKRNSVRHYPLYLQLLDAELSGATHGQMADTLFPGRIGDTQKLVRDSLKAARLMRDSGYRFIIL